MGGGMGADEWSRRRTDLAHLLPLHNFQLNTESCTYSPRNMKLLQHILRTTYTLTRIQEDGGACAWRPHEEYSTDSLGDCRDTQQIKP